MTRKRFFGLWIADSCKRITAKNYFIGSRLWRTNQVLRGAQHDKEEAYSYWRFANVEERRATKVFKSVFFIQQKKF
jgi:hypothetical protein